MNSKSKAQAKYDAKATKHYGIKLNLKTDKDIIDRLNKEDNVQGCIKMLVRRGMAEEERKTAFKGVSPIQYTHEPSEVFKVAEEPVE